MWYRITMLLFLCVLISGVGNCPIKIKKSKPSTPIIYDNEKESSTWRIYFLCDESEITDENKEKLLEVVEFLQINPGKTVKITGYTDQCCTLNKRNRKRYNAALGQRRADAAKAFMIGCDQSLERRIYTKSKGELEPEVIGDSEKAWSKNRRAIISVR